MLTLKPPRRAATRAPRFLLLTYMAIWIGEGALRKWLLPSLQQPLYFLRFTLVIAAVIVAIARLRRPWPLGAHLALTYFLVIVVVTAVHLVRGDQTLVLGILGVRLWLEIVLVPCALGPLLRWTDVIVS